MARRGTWLLWIAIGCAFVALVAVVQAKRVLRGSFRSVLMSAVRPDPVAFYQAEVAEHPGAAIAVLVDTSGSMSEPVPGETRPKYLVAREALEGVLAATDEFARRRPGYPIDVGIFGFNSWTWVALSIQPYDRAAVAKALASLPSPGGGTAIGAALQAARIALYRSGDLRKYIVVVTDGQNTVGSAPDLVARDIHVKSRGGVSMSFVAFDTDPAAFGYLRDLGGEVAAAQDGPALQAALRRIYEGKILAEAAEPGETIPTGSTGQPRAAAKDGRAR
jgi:hypothetical protein